MENLDGVLKSMDMAMYQELPDSELSGGSLTVMLALDLESGIGEFPTSFG